MKRLFVVFLALIYSAGAVEVLIKGDRGSQVTVSPADEQEAMMDAQQYGIRIDSKDARALVKKNRILANAYVEQYGVPKELQVRFRFNLEKALVRELIRKVEKNIDLSDNVLKSYYLANKEEFRVPKKIVFTLMTLPDYQQALSLYNHYKNIPSEVKDFKGDKENNITVEQFTMGLQEMNPALKVVLKDTNATQYLTPPQKFYKNYIVMYVQSFVPAGYRPYDSKVKSEIRALLLKKVYNRTKKELVEKYGAEDEGDE